MSTDQHRDLPLFRWTPPACVVIPFPTVKRIGKIRRTVEVLSGRNGKSADQYWHQIISGMRSQMIAAGLPDDVIEAELRSFADAVFVTMNRGCQRPGGDAA
ncbi:DUF6074 family protein [Mesorhizobium sp. WSM2239]|uniref:DUF6074 family protein n=2 Tax=unclassified Mesorhizobium TaxID=325217 RepID=A0AAU8D6Q8_9HYPH